MPTRAPQPETCGSRGRSPSLDAGTAAPDERRVRARSSSPAVRGVESASLGPASGNGDDTAPSTSGPRAPDVVAGEPHNAAPPATAAAALGPACLRLPEDILILIVNQVVAPNNCEPGAYAPGPSSPVADLKRLAVVHSHFLVPVRTHLYGTPNLEGSLGELKDPCACSLCQVGRSAHWEHAPLRRLHDALVLNPALGTYIRHFDRLGDLTQSLSHFNISPSLVSRTILGVLQRAPNVLSLDMPLVELRNQGDLVEAVTHMTSLRRLKLSTGCVMTKDGTSMMHEGDLRRIARACSELEELDILTEHLGCGSSDGWVEPFPFTELREVRLVRATSVTDKHLLAMLARATHLRSLTIIKSAGLDGTSGVSVPGTTKRTHTLTTTGIAAILERRGVTLKHIHIDVSDQDVSTEATAGTIPSIQSALVACPRLRSLTLAGPGLILPTSLPHLGSLAPSKPSRSFGMPFPGPGGPAAVDLPGLSNLERFSVGLYPPTYRPLLDFLRSLPPSASSPFTSLKSITITNPPGNCTGHDPDANANVSALQAAVADKSIALIFTTPSYDWDTAHAWARPGYAQRAPGLAGFQLLGGPAWAQGPLGWAAGAPGTGSMARRINGAARAGAGGVGMQVPSPGPHVRTRRNGGQAYLLHHTFPTPPPTPAVPATFTGSVLPAASPALPSASALGGDDDDPNPPANREDDAQEQYSLVGDGEADLAARRSIIVNIHRSSDAVASGSGMGAPPSREATAALPVSSNLFAVLNDGDTDPGAE